jgi:hypothetical protein
MKQPTAGPPLGVKNQSHAPADQPKRRLSDFRVAVAARVGQASASARAGLESGLQNARRLCLNQTWTPPKDMPQKIASQDDMYER